MDIIKTLYSDADTRVVDYGIDLPDWLESLDADITAGEVAAILKGGCASGALVLAVIPHIANDTMTEYGDDVLGFIEDHLEELPGIPSGASWSGIAVHFLSSAVELWASCVAEDIADVILENDDEED
jgi:hypothetical protein